MGLYYDDQTCLGLAECLSHRRRVVTEDHYTEDPPSVIQIRDGEAVAKEWTVEDTEDEAANADLGAEVAWHIRLAYERPWELQS